MKSIDDLTQAIFIELLRTYHDGINVAHAAQPQKEIARNLAEEAYMMADEYRRTIRELTR